MNYHINKVIIGLLFILSAISQSSIAEEFCVSSSTEFQSALNTAAGNGQADHIKLKSGNYPILGGSSFSYLTSGSAATDLKISGGWLDFNNGQCNFLLPNTSALDTTINGLSSNRGLIIQIGGNTNFEISAVSISNGINFRGAGLFVLTLTGYTGNVLIENNVFVDNEAEFGSALSVLRGNKIVVRNNLFVANHTLTGSAIELVNNNQRGIYLTNNTIIANSTDAGGAVYVAGSGTSQAFITNNIIWNNDIRDLFFNIDTFLYNNIIGIYSGIPIAETNNISEQPGFQPGILNFTPEYNSNLYNQGIEPPAIVPFPIPFQSDWDVGENDTLGRDRIMNGRIDIGAFEAPPETPIFMDGFE